MLFWHGACGAFDFERKRVPALERWGECAKEAGRSGFSGRRLLSRHRCGAASMGGLWRRLFFCAQQKLHV
ncbi:MAG: hypothetical protein C4334_15105 [Pyrinomonas sp.]